MKLQLTPLCLALACFVLPGKAFAETDAERIAALEARINKLEAVLVQQTTAPNTSSAAQEPSKQNSFTMPNAAPGTQFFFSGFLKLDAMLSKTPNGELADGGIARDLYVPGLIPVGGLGEGSDLDVHAKFSRLIFGTDNNTEDGRSIQTRFEGDFFGNGLGDERFNNATGFVLRHAYLNYNKQWLIGQTWTSFMDASTLPESSDLIGSTDGSVFVRQSMLRYTNGNWMFALENPETTLTPFGGGTRISSDDNTLPDLIVRYNWKTKTGSSLGIAGIMRELSYQSTTLTPVDDRQLGYGLSVFGKIMLDKNDLRFGLTGGSGLGRYIALNLNNDAVIDANNTLKPIKGIYGFIGYHHVFDTQWRANIFYSRAEFDNPIFGGLLQTGSSQSLHANLFYSPLQKWDIGTELIFARRQLENEQSGDLFRLHTSVKYSF